MGRAKADGYDGVPYEELDFEQVTWTVGVANHMATRSARYRRAQFSITDCGWATEATQDPRRLVGDGRSRDGESVRVIGWSASARGREGGQGRLLKVWLVADGPAWAGRWIGRTACEANDSDHRHYWAVENEGSGDDEQ